MQSGKDSTPLFEEMLGKLKMKRLALHASSLEFRHPKTHERVTMSCELPKDMGHFLKKNVIASPPKAGVAI